MVQHSEEKYACDTGKIITHFIHKGTNLTWQDTDITLSFRENHLRQN